MPITPGGGRARVVHAFTHSTFIVVTWRFCMEARDAERLLRVQWVFNVMTTVVSENLEYFNAYLYVCLVCLLKISQCRLGAWKCLVLNSCHREHDKTLVLHSSPVRLCYNCIPSKHDGKEKSVLVPAHILGHIKRVLGYGLRLIHRCQWKIALRYVLAQKWNYVRLKIN